MGTFIELFPTKISPDSGPAGFADSHSAVNEWLERRSDVVVKDIKCTSHNGFFVVMVVYESQKSPVTRKELTPEKRVDQVERLKARYDELYSKPD